MSVIEFQSVNPLVYVILGIDENEHDQVISVCKTYEDAKNYCIKYLMNGKNLYNTPFYDVWIEKHELM
jgi:hypothetical protein